MKKCSECGVDKTAEDFGYVSGRTTLRSQCKSCRAAKVRAQRLEYTEEQKERTRAAKRAYHKQHPEIKRAAKAAYVQRQKAKGPEFNREKKRKYNLSAPGMTAATMFVQKLKLKGAAVAWANRRAMAAFYAQAAAIREGGGDATVDHIVPLNHHLVCGLHNEFNLQILTFMENVEKSNTFHV